MNAADPDGARRRRGQPLLALGLILVCWAAARGFYLGAAFDAEAIAPAAAASPSASGTARLDRPSHHRPLPRALEAFPQTAWAGGDRGRLRIGPPKPSLRKSAAVVPGRWPAGNSAGLTAGLLGSALGAGLAGVVTAGVSGEETPSRTEPSLARDDGAHLRRWSADAWVFVRGEADAASLATGAGSYGGSQFGAVVRYALAPGNRRAPQVYLRATGALGGFADRGAAGGISVRPAATLPIAVMAEARVDRTATGGAMVRPAVAAVGGFGPQPLARGLELEGYGQAGWVGGRDPTGFFDLQAVVDRHLAEPVHGADLRLGGGVWAGGQRGAARIDAGPRLTLRGAVAGAGTRLALDWRFRVAGRAEPGSGPALTLATGF